jgi:hypothetical protein
MQKSSDADMGLLMKQQSPPDIHFAFQSLIKMQGNLQVSLFGDVLDLLHYKDDVI